MGMFVCLFALDFYSLREFIKDHIKCCESGYLCNRVHKKMLSTDKEK